MIQSHTRDISSQVLGSPWLTELPHITPGNGKRIPTGITGSEVCFTSAGSSPYTRVEHPPLVYHERVSGSVYCVCVLRTAS